MLTCAFSNKPNYGHIGRILGKIEIFNVKRLMMWQRESCVSIDMNLARSVLVRFICDMACRKGDTDLSGTGPQDILLYNFLSVPIDLSG